MSPTNGETGLRFASLVRVSTEQQERQGESLAVQRDGNIRDVAYLGGRIVAWYGGQEHATPGWETTEVDRLLVDAAKDQWDAVIVRYADRWSRDNAKSADGLDVLKRNRRRFFVSTTEYDLFKPENEFFLSMSAVIGQFQASNQKKKSIETRIARAQKGMPATGKLPFGRTFDRSKPEGQQWGIDETKRQMVTEVAARYLIGESLQKLAKEKGVNHSNLHKVLTRCSGDIWQQEFRSDALNVHEVVPTRVPRLLPEEVITAVKRRVAANKTYTHRTPKHPYLLNRVTFCADCGYALFAQTNSNGKRYYRHAKLSARDRKCAGPKSFWVNANDLEDAVMRDLFSTFGNAAAVQRAVEAATPNPDRVSELRQRRDAIEGDMAKVAAATERVISAIASGTLTESEAKAQMTKQRERETALKEEQNRLDAELANLPDPEVVKAAARRVSAAFNEFKAKHGHEALDGINYTSSRMWAFKATVNHDYTGLSYEDAKALVEMVFGAKTPDGRRMGVYVEWVPGEETKRRKRWSYRLVGRVVSAFHEGGMVPRPAWWDGPPDGPEFAGGTHQRQLLKDVGLTTYALQMPCTSPPASSSTTMNRDCTKTTRSGWKAWPRSTHRRRSTTTTAPARTTPTPISSGR
jgi:site-specific DNA recombinase